jgi:Holin of 3TMs, for gene-transfer release
MSVRGENNVKNIKSKYMSSESFKPGIGGFLGKILGAGVKETVDSIGNAIDRIDKSDEKLEIQLRYKELIARMEGACIDYEGKLLDSKANIIQAEAKGEGWLQRNWRPTLMLVCIFIVFSNYVLVPFFGIPSAILDDHIWNLIEVGTGGYIAGRSLEKITDKLGPVLVNMKKQK